MTQNALKAHLLQNITRLTRAILDKQLDTAFLYDIIYYAVIQTKQKYKKLANKDRAIDVCISLMKQPKRHVKQSFASIEDCIEKALAAKIVPWKPIVSAVAVVLAATIILPFCLPKKPVYIDPKGFVMEGAQAFANRVEGSNVQLKNFHKISDFGAADIRELANIELSADGSDLGDAQYRIHTTSTGVTFLAQIYVNADTKKSEFILYRGDTDGWHEVGRDTVRYRVNTALVDEGWKSSYNADDTLTMFSDPSGNLYVLSCYNEGLQMHQYSTKGKFSLLDQVWLAEHKQVSTDSGYNRSTTTIKVFSSYDSEKKIVSLACKCEIAFGTFDICYLQFDLSEKIFSKPTPIAGEIAALDNIISIIPTGDGELYLAANEDVVHSATSWDSYYYIYHCDSSGNIIDKSLYGKRLNNSRSVIDNYLLEVRNGELHFVYRIGIFTYYSIYRDGVELSKTKVYAVTTDSWDYMAFFFHNNNLYYMMEIDNKYITIAKVAEEKAVKIAEFEIPILFDEWSFLKNYGFKFTLSDNVLNYIIGECDQANYGWEYVSSYFFQIVLE